MVVEAGEAVGDGLELGTVVARVWPTAASKPASASGRCAAPAGGRLERRQRRRSSGADDGAPASRMGATPVTHTPNSSASRALASRLPPARTRASSSGEPRSPTCETLVAVSPVSRTVMQAAVQAKVVTKRTRRVGVAELAQGGPSGGSRAGFVGARTQQTCLSGSTSAAASVASLAAWRRRFFGAPSTRRKASTIAGSNCGRCSAQLVEALAVGHAAPVGRSKDMAS